MATIATTACTLKPSLHTQTACRGRVSQCPAFRVSRPRQLIVRAEDPKQGDKEEKETSSKPQEVNKGGTAYIDELPVSSMAC